MRNLKPPCCSPIILHPKKVMVRAAIFSKGLIGLFFRFEMVIAPRYLDILRKYVVIQNALEETAKTPWFMQMVPCYIARPITLIS